jgi:hypothetical protein
MNVARWYCGDGDLAGGGLGGSTEGGFGGSAGGSRGGFWWLVCMMSVGPLDLTISIFGAWRLGGTIVGPDGESNRMKGPRTGGPATSRLGG